MISFSLLLDFAMFIKYRDGYFVFFSSLSCLIMIYFDYFQCIVHVKLDWSRRGKCYLKLNHFYRTRNRTCIFEIIFKSAEFNKKFIAYSKTTISNMKETICRMLFLLFSTFLTHIDIK